MKIGVLGTGMVGEAIASKLVEVGHEVMMGSRTAYHEKSTAWVARFPAKARAGTFADAAKFGEIILNCTEGVHSLNALKLAGEANLAAKILIDVANPLDFSQGMPPTLTVCNTDSLGEQIQRAFPKTKVIKTLNTVNCNVMVNPSLVPGDHHLFLSGNDLPAKQAVAGFLSENFGWKKSNLIDLGDITTARGSEQLLPIWVRLWGVIGHPNFNYQIVRAKA
jgi:8-hydroxy-5-deazaflavin:NADPH oxidoreductase